MWLDDTGEPCLALSTYIGIAFFHVQFMPFPNQNPLQKLSGFRMLLVARSSGEWGWIPTHKSPLYHNGTNRMTTLSQPPGWNLCNDGYIVLDRNRTWFISWHQLACMIHSAPFRCLNDSFRTIQLLEWFIQAFQKMYFCCSTSNSLLEYMHELLLQYTLDKRQHIMLWC